MKFMKATGELNNNLMTRSYKVYDSDDNVLLETKDIEAVNTLVRAVNKEIEYQRGLNQEALKWASRGEHHSACKLNKTSMTCNCYVGACQKALATKQSDDEKLKFDHELNKL